MNTVLNIVANKSKIRINNDSKYSSTVIPLAMMQAWSWGWEGGPAYVVYATLGSVISHEVLHAFDLHHRRLPSDPDPSSEHMSWITPEAWRRIEVMIECVAKLYARNFWKKVKFFGNSVDIQVKPQIAITSFLFSRV